MGRGGDVVCPSDRPTMLVAVGFDYARRGVCRVHRHLRADLHRGTASIYDDQTVAALGNGLVIAVMVSAFAAFSGGHLNPAVTVGFFVTRRISVPPRLFYWLMPARRGRVAALLSGGSSRRSQGCALRRADRERRDRPRQGGTIEAVCTFFLVIVVFATAVDAKGAFDKIAGLAIGLTIAFGVLMAGPLTGGALNPARAFGPELVSGYWTDAWVWYVGPLAGGALAAILYEMLYLGRPSGVVAPESADVATRPSRRAERRDRARCLSPPGTDAVPRPFASFRLNGLRRSRPRTRSVSRWRARIFIVFALLSSFVLPAPRSEFPGKKGLRWYIPLCFVLLHRDDGRSPLLRPGGARADEAVGGRPDQPRRRRGAAERRTQRPGRPSSQRRLRRVPHLHARRVVGDIRPDAGQAHRLRRAAGEPLGASRTADRPPAAIRRRRASTNTMPTVRQVAHLAADRRPGRLPHQRGVSPPTGARAGAPLRSQRPGEVAEWLKAAPC